MLNLCFSESTVLVMPLAEYSAFVINQVKSRDSLYIAKTQVCFMHNLHGSLFKTSAHSLLLMLDHLRLHLKMTVVIQV